MTLRLLVLVLTIALSCFADAQHLWQTPKPLVPAADLEKIIGPLSGAPPSKDVHITWVWGYDGGHRPGAHDYLRIRDLMTGLLAKVPRVTVDTAYGFPSDEQFEKTDLLVMYLHLPQLNDAHYAAFKAYVARGGGVVALHESAIIRPAADGKKLAGCLGMAWDEGRSQWGAIFEDISIDNSHEIFKGFPEKIRIIDEFYWHLNQLDTVKILGRVRTGPPRNSNAPVPTDQLSKDPSPMFWTLEPGAGRVFGTTTGHHTFTYYDPEFRIVLFRAIAWALKEKPAPFLPLVFDGITTSENTVGTTSTMRDWKGKLRAPQK